MLTSVMRFGVVCLLLACNGRGTINEENPRTVHGIAVQHNITENGVVDQPRDLSAATFQSEGRLGFGTPDGTFEVPVASGASEWLEMKLGDERVFLANTSQAPDVSFYKFGRGDVQFPASKTSVGFEIAGLGAWQAGDSLQIVSPNVGMTMAGPENEFSAAPSVGSTTISGQALDWKTSFAPSIDATKGDTTWVTQMVGAASGTTHYRTLARAGIARGFTVSDGRPVTLAATLVPVAQDRNLALHLQSSRFAALVSQVGPGAGMAPAATIAIRALPDLLARNNHFFARYYADLPGLVEFGPLPASADLDQTVRYGNPFTSKSGAWTEFVTLVYAFPVPIPTAKAIGSLSAMMVAAVPVSSLAATGVIAPAISPVRDAKVDGQSLDTPRTGVGTSPTLTWEAPAIGTSTSYRVVVHAVDASASGVNVRDVATFHTRSTSLKIPDSVMTEGGSYVFTITAVSAEGADLASRPFVGALPYASADYVTARVTL